MKHTQGEWRQSHRKIDAEGNFSTEVYDEEGETICTLAWHICKSADGRTVYTDREANAKLIAAAPDLLKVCEMAVKSDIDGSFISAAKWFEQMKTAIKKATE